MNTKSKIKQPLQLKIQDLESRLAEAQDTLEAIPTGTLDALIISDGQEERIFSRRGANYNYRVMVEHMTEGAITLDNKGVIVFANKAFAAMVGKEMTSVGGEPLRSFIPLELHSDLLSFYEGCRKGPCRREFSFARRSGPPLPVSFSATSFEVGAECTQCMITTDLTESRRARKLLREAHEDVAPDIGGTQFSIAFRAPPSDHRQSQMTVME